MIQGCCEQVPGCCPDTGYEIKVFLVKDNRRIEKYGRFFKNPVSFVHRIPGTIFNECGLYEIQGTLTHCGSRTTNIVAKHFDEPPIPISIVSMSDFCCECVEVGTLIQLKAIGDFPPVPAGLIAGRWLMYCDDVLARDTGYRPNVHEPFNFVVMHPGNYRVVFEYRNFCGTIRRAQINFKVLKPAFLKKTDCNTYVLSKPCDRNPFNRSYEVLKYEKGQKILVYEVGVNEVVSMTLDAGVYEIRYGINENMREKFVFVNMCSLDHCMEQILDMYLCAEKCTEFKKEIDSYYGQISFLWNYAVRLKSGSEICEEDYCENDEDRYFLLADLIEKLKTVCEDCLSFKNRHECGCQKYQTPVKRIVKQ